MTSRWVLGVFVSGVAFFGTPSPASACGGFFCQATPVVQTAEEILYVVDDDGALTMSVRIVYAGTAEEFAWILPVPSVPTLSLGAAATFDAIGAATAPSFTQAFRVDGICATEPRCEFLPLPDVGPTADAARAFSDAAAADGGAGPGVLIEGELGPFETVVIGDASATEIHEWLTTNGYAIPVESVSILDDYVTSGSLFVALRLRPNTTTDAIQPITLRWDVPTEPCLPIRLTAIATATQLPIIAYFLASTRATPRNYSLIESFDDPSLYGTGTFAYRAWAAREIDALGGHAFVADSAGATPTLSLTLPDIEDLRDASPGDMLRALLERGYDGDPQAPSIRARFLASPAEWAWGQPAYEQCLRDGSECPEPRAYDPGGLIDALNAMVRAPRAAAQGWLDTHAYTTRLYSELSAPEMDLDPEFVLDDGLGDQARAHTAVWVTECSSDYYREEAPLRVDFESGHSEPLFAGVRADATAYCARYGGYPQGMLPDAGVTMEPTGGGGCTAGRGGGIPALGVSLLLVLASGRRRRRPR
jgi:hypothetical protein